MRLQGFRNSDKRDFSFINEKRPDRILSGLFYAVFIRLIFPGGFSA